MNLKPFCIKALLLFLILYVCSSFVLAKPNDVNGQPEVVKALEMIQQKLSSNKPMTWVFTGDSITQGARHTNGWRSYPEHFAERVRWELKRKPDVIINTGMSGDTAAGILQSFDWRVLRFRPDIVSVMIGTNDCLGGQQKHETFRKNLTEMIDRIRKAGAIPLLNTPNPIRVDSYNGSRKDLHSYAQIIRDVASQKNVILVDHWKYWLQQKNTKESLMYWLTDGIHPNEYGHRVLANQIFNAIGIYEPNSPTCRLYVP